MEPIYSNSQVIYNELDIEKRESLIRELSVIVKNSMQSLNPSVKFARVETPIITPESYLQTHIENKFQMLDTSRGILRPETTAGTKEAFKLMYPQAPQRKKIMPICLWQVGKSFRDEVNGESMRFKKLRLVEFYQIEFQLFCSQGTMADYLNPVIDDLINNYGGYKMEITDKPHYSLKTIDWEIDGVEVSSCSLRSDFEDGMLFEISIGLDRLLHILNKNLVRSVN